MDLKPRSPPSLPFQVGYDARQLLAVGHSKGALASPTAAHWDRRLGGRGQPSSVAPEMWGFCGPESGRGLPSPSGLGLVEPGCSWGGLSR